MARKQPVFVPASLTIKLQRTHHPDNASPSSKTNWKLIARDTVQKNFMMSIDLGEDLLHFPQAMRQVTTDYGIFLLKQFPLAED